MPGRPQMSRDVLSRTTGPLQLFVIVRIVDRIDRDLDLLGRAEEGAPGDQIGANPRTHLSNRASQP
jgi:hypothetical protein